MFYWGRQVVWGQKEGKTDSFERRMVEVVAVEQSEKNMNWPREKDLKDLACRRESVWNECLLC